MIFAEILRVLLPAMYLYAVCNILFTYNCALGYEQQQEPDNSNWWYF